MPSMVSADPAQEDRFWIFLTAVIRSAVPHNHPGAPTAPDALTVDVIGSTTNPCISD